MRRLFWAQLMRAALFVLTGLAGLAGLLAALSFALSALACGRLSRESGALPLRTARRLYGAGAAASVCMVWGAPVPAVWLCMLLSLAGLYAVARALCALEGQLGDLHGAALHRAWIGFLCTAAVFGAGALAVDWAALAGGFPFRWTIVWMNAQRGAALTAVMLEIWTGVLLWQAGTRYVQRRAQLSAMQ